MALPEKVNNVKNIPTKISEAAYELSRITIRVGLYVPNEWINNTTQNDCIINNSTWLKIIQYDETI